MFLVPNLSDLAFFVGSFYIMIMNKEELLALFDSCESEMDFDYAKYDEAIKAKKGGWFSYCRDESDDVYDISMIDYMREVGFIVLDDPFSQNMCNFVGWVVFPPKDNGLAYRKATLAAMHFSPEEIEADILHTPINLPDEVEEWESLQKLRKLNDKIAKEKEGQDDNS